MLNWISLIVLLVVFGIVMLFSKFIAFGIVDVVIPDNYKETEDATYGLVVLYGVLSGFIYYFIAYFITVFFGDAFSSNDGSSVLEMAKYGVLAFIFIKGLRPAKRRGLLDGARFGMHITSASVISGYYFGSLLVKYFFKY